MYSVKNPLAFSSAGISELGGAGRERESRIVMTGLCFRYHDGLRKAKSLLESGRFGRLVSIRCMMGEKFPAVRPDYRTLFSSKYSGAFDLTHEVDLAVWFAESPVRKVMCAAGSFSDDWHRSARRGGNSNHLRSTVFGIRPSGFLSNTPPSPNRVDLHGWGRHGGVCILGSLHGFCL